MRRYVHLDNTNQEQQTLKTFPSTQISLSQPLPTILGLDLPNQSRWQEDRPVNFTDEKPHLWFDNFAAIDPTQFNDLEIMGYSNLDVFKMYNHPPMIAAMREKPGAPEELAFQRERVALEDLVGGKGQNQDAEADESNIRGRISKAGRGVKGGKGGKGLKGKKKVVDKGEDEDSGDNERRWDVFCKDEGLSDNGDLFDKLEEYDILSVNVDIPRLLVNTVESISESEAVGKSQIKSKKRGDQSGKENSHPAINLFVMPNGNKILSVHKILLSI